MTRPRRRPGTSSGLSSGLSTGGVPALTRARLDPSDRNRREQAGRHGLTVEELDALGDACSVCGFTGPLVVDHDHELAALDGHRVDRGCARCVRGVLCDYCNTGLAKFRDDPALLRAGADYVEAFLLRRSRLEGMRP